ncbi:hypothetical protein HYG86_05105 [Alkalicella caledoniensis]|uniref:Uncharacterized protein n=1 Tax=Alkalicella caledoniensis TaxID=2731377 RepID=A0A7G9W680_ALKCA|nr:hypothetical protein [Alkalicella caledoniensis]QNO14192.1 hypothetical protein HYG86_05105 [Alkalicella caledoniensis]
MNSKNAIIDLIVVVAITLLFIFITWLFLPPLFVINFISSWIIVLLYAVILTTYFSIRTKKVSVLAIPAVILIFMLGFGFFNSAIFTHSSRHTLIGNVEEKDSAMK